MPYVSSGLRRALDGTTNVWILDTTDLLATAFGANYITDAAVATTGSSAGTPGKGMQLGDIVIARVVAALPPSGMPPAAAPSAVRIGFVSALTTAGAGSLTAIS